MWTLGVRIGDRRWKFVDWGPTFFPGFALPTASGQWSARRRLAQAPSPPARLRGPRCNLPDTIRMPDQSGLWSLLRLVTRSDTPRHFAPPLLLEGIQTHISDSRASNFELRTRLRRINFRLVTPQPQATADLRSPTCGSPYLPTPGFEHGKSCGTGALTRRFSAECSRPRFHRHPLALL